ncbi:uncharacterized protein LOC130704931 [Balaenoptera acutorostrata]|uniref:Uncharacterized protein LOC130704931 n=1 Tax=Balaenoptera acutorostrata TaxID=9767 RepID=A0ABM3S7D5_BALAC|nr:uncharacterized protein LOC130704931 [Balaenoptera acutorostrata]
MGVWNAQPAAVGLVRCRHPASPWEGFSAGTIAETSSSLRSTVTTEAALCVGLAPAQLWLSGVGLYGLPRTLSPALSESGRTWWVLGSSPLPYGPTRRQFRMSSQPTSAEKSSFLRVAFPSLDSGGLILNCLPRRWTIFLTQGRRIWTCHILRPKTHIWFSSFHETLEEGGSAGSPSNQPKEAAWPTRASELYKEHLREEWKGSHVTLRMKKAKKDQSGSKCITR